jgi:hypothetical protein
MVHCSYPPCSVTKTIVNAVVVNELSRTATGKLSKLALRQKYQAPCWSARRGAPRQNSAIMRAVSAWALGVSGRTPGLGMECPRLR